jgi:hypothetical protein
MLDCVKSVFRALVQLSLPPQSIALCPDAPLYPHLFPSCVGDELGWAIIWMMMTFFSALFLLLNLQIPGSVTDLVRVIQTVVWSNVLKSPVSVLCP